jgi:hypothetical protein
VSQIGRGAVFLLRKFPNLISKFILVNMWLSEEQIENFGLRIIRRPKTDYQDWAERQLPKSELPRRHPYCNGIETALIHALKHTLPTLFSIGRVATAKYIWKGEELVLEEDFSPSVLSFRYEGGPQFLGGYRRDNHLYSYPCVGVTTIKTGSGFVPIFLTDEQLAEGQMYDESNSLFIRARKVELSQTENQKLSKIIG